VRIAALLPVLFVAGCANIPPESVSDVRLCEYTLYGSNENQLVASREANRRGLDCNRYYLAIIARRQQQNAATAAAIQMLNASRPAHPPQPVNCTTQVWGNQAQTYCR
jgi:hypothetical protein